ncbi:hypothetical protein [Mucilaginibacter paludis]|uniref:Uncharacterized protein n=1 Tax=Mucilaginibacter paludis DSM 18603 TaxID=714943 RepID=H1YAK7_9SPHI|nr:hypothetical protein [Mucilaginibacter paludis]EHQ29127.1 hypothetical protein Mucpa_5049 [Mucilaginibacter paludis DSM 18603]
MKANTKKNITRAISTADDTHIKKKHVLQSGLPEELSRRMNAVGGDPMDAGLGAEPIGINGDAVDPDKQPNND